MTTPPEIVAAIGASLAILVIDDAMGYYKTRKACKASKQRQEIAKREALQKKAQEVAKLGKKP